TASSAETSAAFASIRRYLPRSLNNRLMPSTTSRNDRVGGEEFGRNPRRAQSSFTVRANAFSAWRTALCPGDRSHCFGLAVQHFTMHVDRLLKQVYDLVVNVLLDVGLLLRILCIGCVKRCTGFRHPDIGLSACFQAPCCSAERVAGIVDECSFLPADSQLVARGRCRLRDAFGVGFVLGDNGLDRFTLLAPELIGFEFLQAFKKRIVVGQILCLFPIDSESLDRASQGEC